MAKYKVLSTKKLDTSLVDEAIKENIEIIEKEFITVKHDKGKEKFNEVFQLMTARKAGESVVFTSANAIIPFQKFLDRDDSYNVVKWKVFCLSGKTKDELETHYGKLLGEAFDTADNATALAQKIIAHGVKKIIFFCGNKRRNELPDILKTAGIEVHEVVMYETVETPVMTTEDFDAIIFFSPSAVKSFFSKNQLNNSTVCFAIGKTTADSIAQFTENRIIISETPSQKIMLEDIKLYFQNRDSLRAEGIETRKN